ncbi:carbohydrate-binding protein [uncultured Hymenobacter sp.]|uniref:carbohydrate-binding protein n=1 Tax=uncultured Hymenobacter sp. TaxID=170016 RepID=UPI0035CABED6
MKKLFLVLLGVLTFLDAQAQPAAVAKTNPTRVYMHYMPWFETPQTSGTGQWGVHWTMANQNPNIIVDAATGKRQIAAHYYPLIGPYASSDPDVLEYHLLLMKYAGVDGVLVDFYGNGGNDLPLLLRNTNAVLPRSADVGLGFAVVFEDQFAATLNDAKANMQYVGTNYFPKANYIKLNNKPLVLTFGPQKYQTPSDWTQILGVLPTPPTFLTLWYQSQQAGANAAGEYNWIYSDFLTGLQNFYQNRVPTLSVAGGVAYPGFNGFYAQGGWAGPTWTIAHNNGQTLSQTLSLAKQYQSRLGFVQLATFNDFGEGTMFEPTREFGFSYLVQVQQYTGAPYTETELRQVHRLYNLRKQYAGNTTKQSQLNQAFGYFVALRVADAVAMLNTVEGTTAPAPSAQTIPGRIEAESFAAQSGTQTEGTTDTGGGLNVDYFDTNDWLDYKVNVQTAGTYKVDFRVASAVGNARLELRNSAGTVLGSISVGNTGGWQSWQTLSVNVSLPAGAQTLRLFAAASTGCNVNWLSFAAAASPAASFSRQIEAESFSVNNGMIAETCAEGGQNMGYIVNGDNLIFNSINFPNSGAYLIEYRVACGTSGGSFSADLNNGAVSFGTTNVPGTGGWQTWRTISQTVNVNAGTYNLRILAQVGDWNINWLRISQNSTAARGTLASAAPAAASELTVYPNPATDRLLIRSAQSLTDTRFRILDAVGRTVASGSAAAGSLDVARLRPGAYTLVLTAEGRAPKIRRFVK